MTAIAPARFAAFGAELLRKNWGWILAVGIIQIVLGMAAAAASVFVTVVSVVLFGWLLAAGGILAVIHAFRQKGWGGFFLDLFMGVLYTVTGIMVITHPVAAALNLTLVIALFMMAGGVFRILAGMTTEFENRIWVILNGVITLALGVMIWRDWPVSGLWVIGLFIGIDFLAYGWSLVMLALAARRLPSSGADGTAV